MESVLFGEPKCVGDYNTSWFFLQNATDEVRRTNFKIFMFCQNKYLCAFLPGSLTSLHSMSGLSGQQCRLWVERTKLKLTNHSFLFLENNVAAFRTLLENRKMHWDWRQNKSASDKTDTQIPNKVRSNSTWQWFYLLKVWSVLFFELLLHFSQCVLGKIGVRRCQSSVQTFFGMQGGFPFGIQFMSHTQHMQCTHKDTW